MLTLQELKTQPKITPTTRKIFNQIITSEVSRAFPDSLVDAIKEAFDDDPDAKQALFRLPKSVTEQLLDVPKSERRSVNVLVLHRIESKLPFIRGLNVTVTPTLSPARYRLELVETTPISQKVLHSMVDTAMFDRIATVDMFNIGDTANRRKADAIENVRSDEVYAQDLMELRRLLITMSVHFANHHQKDSSNDLLMEADQLKILLMNIEDSHPGFCPQGSYNVALW